MEITSTPYQQKTLDVTLGISRRESGTTKFAHAGLKNDSAQTVAAQTVAGTKRYDAFGLLTSSTGSWSGQFSYGGPFGYQEDSESGLKLLGHRYYDASTGRFLTRDPIGDGNNWYAYCQNNPITSSDETGLLPILIIFVAKVAIGYGGRLAAAYLARNAARVIAKQLLALTVRNFRANLIRFTGFGGLGYQAHHMVPQAVWARLRELGVNINFNHPSWGQWWRNGSHQQWQRYIQQRWEQFLSAYTRERPPTEAELKAFGQRLAREVGNASGAG
jgi:RHS repeat-associated protein